MWQKQSQELTRDQPRPKYIFNKCGTIIYFFTLQRFGPSPSRNFRYSLVSCFYVSLFSDIGSQIRNRARVKRLQPSPTPITWSCPGWYIKTADGMKTDPCTQRRKAEKKPKKNVLCPNLMNLSHVSNPSKTGFNWSPA